MDIKIIFFGIIIFISCCIILYRYVINLANDIERKHTEKTKDNVPLEPGLHIYPGSNGETECISKTPDVYIISKTIKETDWSDIAFVILVKRLNHEIEVSGSSNPDDGFAAIYKKDNIWASSKMPPDSINEMVEILCAFHKDEERALDKYEFE